MKTIDIKRLNGIRREIEIESKAEHGPQHGRAGAQRSARDKARCPRRQRKNRSWMHD